MLEEEDYEFPLTDDDIRVAVRRWLDTPPWKQRLQIVDEMSPGGLRAYHESLPDTLLKMSADEGVSYGDNLSQEANAALEHSEYFDVRSGDRLRRTAAALQNRLREYVDSRMNAVFGQEDIPTATGQPIAAAAPPKPTPNMQKLSTFISEWQKDISAGYNRNKALKDADQYRQSVELFIGLMGDLPLGRIDFEKAAEFRELYLQMPATHGKGSIASPKQELVRARASKNVRLVSMRTALRHFTGMRSLWKWLVFKKHISSSSQPFSGHSFPGAKPKRSPREDWSLEDLERLFMSREYLATSDASALHWLPLIALHTGMRLEEICRLRPRLDVIIKNALPCIDIKPHLEEEGWAPWDPKSGSGIRIIPIHSWLIRHGFLEFVERQRSAGADYLFSPELVLHEKKLSSGFSREFSRIKTELGVGRKTTFHSFRHSFRTILESTDLKTSHINAVMGHEGNEGEGSTYTHGVATTKLKEVVESFNPLLTLDFLQKAGSGSTPIPGSKVRVVKRRLTPPVFDDHGKLVRQRKK